MTNEIVELKESYLEIGKKLWETIALKSNFSKHQKIVVAIAGESGSGKSVTAFALQKEIEKAGIGTLVFSIDNYFKLPPKANHNQRVENINAVGTQEVHLDILQNHLNAFKNNATSLIIPLTNYKLDCFDTMVISLANKDILIVEGTYVFELEGIDLLIFMERTYKETFEQRKARNRDVMSNFVEEILEVEHQIIKEGLNKAHILIDKNYQITHRS